MTARSILDPKAWSVLAVLTLIGACGQSVDDPMQQQPHVVRGMAVHASPPPVPLTLSGEARVVAELLDLSTGEADGAEVVARQELQPAGQVPLPLELRYRPGELEAEAELAVRVTVHDRGERFLITETAAPVDRQLASEIVEVLLTPTAAALDYLATLPGPEASDQDDVPGVPAFESDVPEDPPQPPGVPSEPGA